MILVEPCEARSESAKSNDFQSPGETAVDGDPVEQIDTLASHDTRTLRMLWQRCHNRRVPPSLSRDLIIRMAAYKLQEKILGGLSAATKRKLNLLSRQLKVGNLPDGSAAINLKPGTRLVRSWRGQTFEVLVLDNGFELAGKTFTSLSSIASEITGAHWSGPRFFGLKPRHRLPPRQKEGGSL